tara:strand:- start:9 stop:284 length:276 start_codon:yes stop_codon:yes gene_type:complete
MSGISSDNKFSAKENPVKNVGKKTFLSEFFFVYSLGAIILSNFMWFDFMGYFGEEHKLLAIYVGVWVPTTMSLSYVFRVRPVSYHSALKYK